MWGPANALLEENLTNDQQGLAPRVFEWLFDRINEVNIRPPFLLLKIINRTESVTITLFGPFYFMSFQEQIKHADKQLKYQCRCSFLEVA